MNETMITELKKRAAAFLSASDVPVTKMCKRLDMATSSYYRWQRGILALSESRLETIDSYLNQFGY